MRYFVEVAGREHVVDLSNQPDGSVKLEVDGKPVAVDAVTFGPRALSVRVGARVADLTIEGSPPQLGVVASGHRTYVKVESERMRAASRVSAASGGGRERDVRSPMPGRIVKMLVAEGETVAAGRAVAIVEAMKMENEVRAKKGGIVAKVHCAPGATVEGNAVLVSFQG
jgi:biotin carboxyl carrier protein